MKHLKTLVLGLALVLAVTGNLVIDASSGILTVAPAPVPQTGQSISHTTGDDGASQTGIEWDAATRFTDNDDGTVTDNLTGLIWLKDADCLGAVNWSSGLKSTVTLENGLCDLTDGSVDWDWRMPNVREMASLIDYGQKGRALPIGHPFLSVRSTYWTSTSSLQYPSLLAWTVDLFLGGVDYDSKSLGHYVWPVKGEGIGALDFYLPLVQTEGGEQ